MTIHIVKTNILKIMWKGITFFLLFLGLTSTSLAEEKQFYQYITLNSNEEAAWSSGLDSSPDENASMSSVKPIVDRDCSASTYEVTLFSSCEGEDSQRLWRQTKIMVFAGFGVAGVIALLPEQVSGWGGNDYQATDLLNNWYNNVKAGPVWDGDDLYLNIIGHPYFGGVYYQAARKSGYNQWNSFIYSALMSTFYWEYGLEAFAEVPSIQDLVITPVGGWIYGEWAHHKEKDIIANGGRALGSKFWGGIALFLLDPVGQVDDWCCVSKKVEVTAFNIAHWPAQRYSQDINAGKDYWGVKFSLQF